MFLIAHAAIGSAVALAVCPDQPGFAFAVGWFSHYVADFVPHGDEIVGVWTKRGNEIRRFALVAGADLLLLTAVVLIIFSQRGWNWTVAFASAGAISPDVLWGLEKAVGRNLFGPMYRWHSRIHKYLGIHLPLRLGLSFQFAVAAALWSFCLRRM